MSTTHEHRESRTCDCYPLALEPSAKCPVHGHPWPRRCEECGQFMPWPAATPTPESAE